MFREEKHLSTAFSLLYSVFWQLVKSHIAKNATPQRASTPADIVNKSHKKDENKKITQIGVLCEKQPIKP